MNQQTFQITGMDCADCARSIETGVGRLAGVLSCSVNLTAATLRVEGEASPATITQRVRELGYSVAAQEAKPANQTPPKEQNAILGFIRFLLQRRDTTLALIGALLILPGLLFGELLPLFSTVAIPAWVNLFSVAALAVAGYPIILSAWRKLRINHEISINLLMTIAALGALVIGAVNEAGLVMVLFAIGEALEGFTMERARQSIRSLLQVAPNQASKLIRSGEKILSEALVNVSELQIGDHIIVKPGERIAMDGRVIEGVSAVNQAPITGESMPVAKAIGDSVFAGSINGSAALEIAVTQLAVDNTISCMIRMVEEAQERRAPVQRVVDQFARIYTPAVVIVAALVAILPPLFFNQPFWNPDGETQGWLYRALALLVVACPCALVISTPVSIVAAISTAARRGVMIKGGAFLEALSGVRAIAFDKTGTLTEGRPSVVLARSVNCLDEEPCQHCDDLLALASAVEQRSEHPLAAAVLNAAGQRNVAGTYPVAQGVMALAGQGVTGQVAGRQVMVGSHGYFDANISHTAAHCQAIEQSSGQGHTPMLVSVDGDYHGYITVADKVRESSRQTLTALRASGIEALVMLTGDRTNTAQHIASEIGVTDVRAELLPQQKVEAITGLLTTYGAVAMVGDGVNDAPALATATVGIAMGASGSAQALETADVALMNDSLDQLPFALQLSKRAMQTIRQNIGLALGIKLLFLLAVLVGVGSMWLAVLADVGASILVTLNGMRLLMPNE